MMENRRLLVTVTALALAGVLGLFLYSASLAPLEMGIGDITEGHTGALVSTEGTVTETRAVSGGAVSLTLCDFNSSSAIGVFYASDTGGRLPEGIVPGARVRVSGEVRIYQESPEIYVTKAADITLVSAAGNSEYALDILVESIHMFEGMNVTTSARMTDLEAVSSHDTLVGTAFTLVGEFGNQSYSLGCFCSGRDLTLLHSEWDNVTVTGQISYYTSKACWQLNVQVVTPRVAECKRY